MKRLKKANKITFKKIVQKAIDLGLNSDAIKIDFKKVDFFRKEGDYDIEKVDEVLMKICEIFNNYDLNMSYYSSFISLHNSCNTVTVNYDPWTD